MFGIEDTIVAVSSAAGAAARSIVRLSGPDASRLASTVFSGPLSGQGGFRVVAGVVSLEKPRPAAAPARAYVFRAPRSYTRQDVVELHVPGQTLAFLACSALISAGARQAEPGEFTARAFLNGRLDLASAEAVADVVDAEADAELRSAVGMLGGALSKLCRPASEALAEVLATAEASIDFADENLELSSPDRLEQAITQVADDLDAALSRSHRWVPATSEPKVAIAGRPNAGKSTLLNALSGMDRAIVSALAGTTRDVLSAPAKLPSGREVLLLDAAGLAEPNSPLELAAHSAARDAVAAADGLLFVLDATEDDQGDDRALLEELSRLNRRAPVIVLANKIDLVCDLARRMDHFQRRLGQSLRPVSAVTGQGLGEIREDLAEALRDRSAPQPGQLLLHERQRRGIEGSAAAARRGAQLLSGAEQVIDVAEILAVELRAALRGLAELTGDVVAEDVLSAIFARFCVGK